MTISIFPEADHAPVEPPVSDTTGPAGRWVLHRAGIVNVWQYDRVELRFAGGRMLLRGKNGAGKSKALEMLLPFLLDGDIRRLDAAGRDRTTVRWLMTDGRPAGNHVGYVWLELRATDPDGDNERFHTLGAGLKVSTAAARSDAWFFCTDQRVGVDLRLERNGECLTLDKLKEAVGDEAVTESGAEHRRRVGRHLFGLFDEARYNNLLHLLHRLRDPNIGNRVEAGELASVLSDALPPIDERVLTDAAGRFDDLESIREQVERADRTAAALGQFLGVYGGYSRTILSQRTTAVESAERERAAAERARAKAERSQAATAGDVDRTRTELDALKQERVDRDDERRGLEASEAYRAHLDLAEREAMVVALDQAAASAESATARSAAAHERAVAEAERAGREVDETAAAAAASDGRVRSLIPPSGVDPNLLAVVALAARPIADDVIADAERRAQATSSSAHVRHQRAGELRALAVQAERAADRAVVADEAAAQSEAALEEASRALADHRTAHRAAARAWTDEIRQWARSGGPASVDADWSDVEQILDDTQDRRDDGSWPDAVRSAVRVALAPALDTARAAAATAAIAASAAAAAADEAEAQVASLETDAEATPARSRYRAVDRDPAAGAPFYELVDTRDAADSDALAGLEAALEASGMLDAWVSADGLVVHPRTHDVIARATEPLPPGTATIGDVLRPAIPSDSPVSETTVEALLAAVALGEHATAATWMTVDGRWSSGVVRGAWSKEGVEFIGAGARRETRRRQLDAARATLRDRRAEHGRAEQSSRDAAGHRAAIEALPDALPPADAVAAAHRALTSADLTAGHARSRHDADQRAAAEVRTTANRLAAAVADAAANDGLPSTIEGIDDVVEALNALTGALDEFRRDLAGLRRTAGRFAEVSAAVAERDREVAADRAEAVRRRREHERASGELASLRDALGVSVQDVLDRHAAAVARIADLEQSAVPAAEFALQEAIKQGAEAAVRREESERNERAAIETLADVAARLDAAVDLPGVFLAATKRDPVGLGRGVQLALAVAPLVQGDDDIGETLLWNRLQTVSDSLRGGYDIAMDDVDGVKVVHVLDDSGRRPLAQVAALLNDEAQAARGRLAAREREVLERFLLRELADEVRRKLLDAHDLVTGTNRTLHGVRTSHGKGARLEWAVHDDAPEAARRAVPLLVDELRDEAGDAALRDALLALIDVERTADPGASYEQHLRRALDYRSWHRFAVKVTDAAQPGSLRTLSNRLGLSQGEQRVLSYLALFAAAAAHFDAVAREMPEAPRLLLLDDAFAKVDEPTHGQLLGVLVELGLDYVLTSERMWGCFPTVPGIEIYEAIRDPSTPGVALMHFHWDGHQRTLVSV